MLYGWFSQKQYESNGKAFVYKVDIDGNENMYTVSEIRNSDTPPFFDDAVLFFASFEEKAKYVATRFRENKLLNSGY